MEPTISFTCSSNSAICAVSELVNSVLALPPFKIFFNIILSSTSRCTKEHHFQLSYEIYVSIYFFTSLVLWFRHRITLWWVWRITKLNQKMGVWNVTFQVLDIVRRDMGHILASSLHRITQHGIMQLCIDVRHPRPHCGPDDSPIVNTEFHTMHFNNVSLLLFIFRQSLRLHLHFSLHSGTPVP
jgi:hypothetical protein